MNLPVSVLIPVLNPTIEFIGLVTRIAQSGVESVLVVNDGSRPETNSIFESLRLIDRVTVISHATNLGKGRALKTGINYFLQTRKGAVGIVTADADGQHTIDDILAVATALAAKPSTLVIGARTFKAGIPLRSLVGNQMTKYIYALLVGKKISDTQSGLRGLPSRFLPAFLKTSGEAYEYEMNVLIQCKILGVPVQEIPIETIYIEGNRSSHFNPLLDSMKIYFLLLRFAFSSLSASLVDFVIFAAVYQFISTNIWACLISARAIASAFNFLVNRRFVFQVRGQGYEVLIKYYALVGVLMTFAYLGMREMVSRFGAPVLVSKVVVESILFLVSFTIQRDFIFNRTLLPKDDTEETGLAKSVVKTT